MIKRVVKLEIQEKHHETFIEIFKSGKETILTFEGCLHLELIRDVHSPSRFFTLSHWEEEKYLDEYRKSVFFKETWSKVKTLFENAPLAWSTETIG